MTPALSAVRGGLVVRAERRRWIAQNSQVFPNSMPFPRDAVSALRSMAHFEKRSRDGSLHAAGFRSLRLEELFREELNFLLDGEVSDPRLEDTRVTRVELSRDGSRARIWFAKTSSDVPHTPDETRAAFEGASGFFRSRLCDALSLKRVPELRFRHDPALLTHTDPYE